MEILVQPLHFQQILSSQQVWYQENEIMRLNIFLFARTMAHTPTNWFKLPVEANTLSRIWVISLSRQ